jgi:hypothetical protein
LFFKARFYKLLTGKALAGCKQKKLLQILQQLKCLIM